MVEQIVGPSGLPPRPIDRIDFSLILATPFCGFFRNQLRDTSLSLWVTEGRIEVARVIQAGLDHGVTPRSSRGAATEP